MKRKILLVITVLLSFTFIQAQTSKSKKDKTISGYAITSAQKGDNGWKEVRLVNINTGEELKSIYQSKQEVQPLNARTGEPIAKKEINVGSGIGTGVSRSVGMSSNSTVVSTPVLKTVPVNTSPEKKVINLDDELRDQVRVRTVIYVNEVRNMSVQTDKPFATNSAAMAYDKKHDRLYYTPMGINQLRYIDLKTNKIYYFENEPFGTVSGMGDAMNQITRMVIGADGNGYALTNSSDHLIRFTVPKKAESTEITDLGALTDETANTKYSVHSRAGFGGDMIADAQGNLYLIQANHHVFKFDINSKIAKYIGTINGLPQGFTTNGAMVEEGSKVIVASSQSTVGYYRFDLNTMESEKVSGDQQVFNASDLANGVLAFEKQKKQKKEKEEAPIVQGQPAQQDDVAKEKQVVTPELITNNNLSVYPNPVTQGYFKAQFNQFPAGKYSMKLFDLSGQLISSKEIIISSNTQTEQFRLPDFVTKGSYLLKVVNENNSIALSNKITVQ
jgi:type IX secretion system substrate protein